MKDLKIIFMGTPSFAVASLESLINAKYNIVGVITAPDKPAGRGRKIRQSAVKEYAVKQDLKILQPSNLKDSEFLNELDSLQADLQIVVAFRMLPKEVWTMPKIGTFNLHASLLPEYRGAAPINWAIINGETKTGVTTFFINEKIDTGSILLQKEVDIPSSVSAGELHDSLMTIGSDLIISTIELLESGNYQLKPQPSNETKSASKLNKNNCKIDWNDTIDNIYNKIRGLSPYPAAWSYLNNQEDQIELKIYESERIEEIHSYESGKLMWNKKELKVAVNNGYIKMLELKIAGKRKMPAQDLLNGYKFYDGAKLL